MIVPSKFVITIVFIPILESMPTILWWKEKRKTLDKYYLRVFSVNFGARGLDRLGRSGNIKQIKR